MAKQFPLWGWELGKAVDHLDRYHMNNSFSWGHLGMKLFFQVASAIKHALKIGYRHIDAAHLYGNEREVGQGIREAMNEYSIKR